VTPGADGTAHSATDSLPYWAATGPDGRHCFVSLSNVNAVSVVDFATAKEVARLPAGHFPQRERLAKVPEDVLGSLSTAARRREPRGCGGGSKPGRPGVGQSSSRSVSA
jgi:hypothetical protein